MIKYDLALRTYIIVWGLAQGIEFMFGSMAKQGNFEKVQMILVCFSFIFPEIAPLAMMSRVFGLLSRLPNTFDSEWLAAISDCTVALAIFMNCTEALPKAMSLSLGIFYLAAGGLKINTAFLNPQVSCASYYAVQLLIALDLPPIQFLVHNAGLMTITIEMSIGLFMLLRPKIGVLLALLLHFGIALTPPPNNIAGFGVIAAVRCFWLVYSESASTAANIFTSISLSGIGCAALVTATARLHTDGPSVQIPHRTPSFDYPAAAYGAIATYLLCLIYSNDHNNETNKQTKSKEKQMTFIFRFSSILTFIWCFVPITLGIMDAASPNMFSNLRMTGNTNHLLQIPTGLLQKIFYNHKASVFSGGYFRVSSSNSTVLNSIHPGELTPILTPATRQALESYGIYPRFFNPAVANIVGPNVMPTNVPRDLQYTLPAYELHRVLLLDPNPVQITITKLDGTSGDEDWRRTSGNHTLHIEFSPAIPIFLPVIYFPHIYLVLLHFLIRKFDF